MEEFKISVFIAIFEEMFGVFVWWSLVTLVILVAVLFLYFLIKEKRRSKEDFTIASIAAPLAGIAAIFIVLGLTSSSFSDLRGTIDYVIIAMVAIFSAIATLVSVYVAQSIIVKFRTKEKL